MSSPCLRLTSSSIGADVGGRIDVFEGLGERVRTGSDLDVGVGAIERFERWGCMRVVVEGGRGVGGARGRVDALDITITRFK